MSAFVTALICPRCQLQHDPQTIQNLCVACQSPLLVEYDLDRLRTAVSKETISERTPTMWRYREFLPVGDPTQIVSLGEGFTPLLNISSITRAWGLTQVWLKDDGLNPTGSFKARGASCGISKAKEFGIRAVALPTAGNAGGAWACYGAAAGIRVHVAMPKDAPAINQLECRLYGADLQLVDGLISDAGKKIAQGIREHGWFDAATLKEPYRIEGKKTLGLEIAEQLGWQLPDAIVYPAGGGVGIIGIWRALKQLRAIGWVSGKLPRLIVVQAEGCAPLVKAFEEQQPESEFWPNARTFASGLRVPKALGDFLVLQAVRETGGTALAVSDADCARMMRLLAERAGIFAAPEGAATLAAVERLQEEGKIFSDERVVIINTGSALKYPEAMAEALAGQM
ncbi:threonine synthase [Gloeobacter kilaueensis]|uniref:Threonine synthase n=1 Tax=Gloeobacter kilaueensis (strain ATCC BAA-2537 / CCAP 1431/1 / ULC 316 / JS1) TaxID=1183438 RepID=U5QS08_GLOK1|nr:threonine synthase [Gloeobacter kilaueensis]AGY60480.1 threonine synthase [Gloeobacter kilaueensis JS1]